MYIVSLALWREKDCLEFELNLGYNCKSQAIQGYIANDSYHNNNRSNNNNNNNKSVFGKDQQMNAILLL